jgi:hypothetical protein
MWIVKLLLNKVFIKLNKLILTYEVQKKKNQLINKIFLIFLRKLKNNNINLKIKFRYSLLILKSVKDIIINNILLEIIKFQKIILRFLKKKLRKVKIKVQNNYIYLVYWNLFYDRFYRSDSIDFLRHYFENFFIIFENFSRNLYKKLKNIFISVNYKKKINNYLFFFYNLLYFIYLRLALILFYFYSLYKIFINNLFLIDTPQDAILPVDRKENRRVNWTRFIPFFETIDFIIRPAWRFISSFRRSIVNFIVIHRLVYYLFIGEIFNKIFFFIKKIFKGLIKFFYNLKISLDIEIIFYFLGYLILIVFNRFFYAFYRVYIFFKSFFLILFHIFINFFFFIFFLMNICSYLFKSIKKINDIFNLNIFLNLLKNSLILHLKVKLNSKYNYGYKFFNFTLFLYKFIFLILLIIIIIYFNYFLFFILNICFFIIFFYHFIRYSNKFSLIHIICMFKIFYYNEIFFDLYYKNLINFYLDALKKKYVTRLSYFFFKKLVQYFYLYYKNKFKQLPKNYFVIFNENFYLIQNNYKINNNLSILFYNYLKINNDFKSLNIFYLQYILILFNLIYDKKITIEIFYFYYSFFYEIYIEQCFFLGKIPFFKKDLYLFELYKFFLINKFQYNSIFKFDNFYKFFLF